MSRLTANQRIVLDILTSANQLPLTIPALAAVADTTPEGVTVTAASLVRRGLAERVTVHLDGRDRVAYVLVDTRDHERGQTLLAHAETAGMFADDPEGL